jgi:hypothetical protein
MPIKFTTKILINPSLRIFLGELVSPTDGNSSIKVTWMLPINGRCLVNN